ncbi:hypothetical protein V6N12_002960 [Hibiscus sabdariffa]|uniref:Uncharacterized protein n=1 Tax=Hibiscus sabdariffa TaxID=183260 RepID=A0ABR2EAH9_9ROSI
MKPSVQSLFKEERRDEVAKTLEEDIEDLYLRPSHRATLVSKDMTRGKYGRAISKAAKNQPTTEGHQKTSDNMYEKCH